MTPTEQDLKAAYKRSGLWRLGMTYQRAISLPPVLTALTCSVAAHHKKAAQTGKPLPHDRAIDALREAAQTPHHSAAKLYSDGERLAWSITRMGGDWFGFGGSLKVPACLTQQAA